MTSVEWLLADLQRRGVALQAKGDRLAVAAPAGVLDSDDRFCISEVEAEMVALLSGDRLDARDGTPPIEVSCDWRWEVADWPHDRWVEWRRLSAELQPADPTAEQIRAADRVAYDLVADDITKGCDPLITAISA